MKRIRMKRSVATARTSYSKGDTADVTDAIAAAWVKAGAAEDVTPDDYDDDQESESADDTAAVDDLDGLKLAELRDRADTLGLSTDGKKAELVERIREHQAAG